MTATRSSLVSPQDIEDGQILLLAIMLYEILIITITTVETIDNHCFDYIIYSWKTIYFARDEIDTENNLKVDICFREKKIL